MQFLQARLDPIHGQRAVTIELDQAILLARHFYQPALDLAGSSRGSVNPLPTLGEVEIEIGLRRLRSL
ncbi:hypothetical protein shn_14850 [Shinella sp. HZN7]|nr:hypothetical protein shn_14850 [Shinella sp. HZN7]